MERYKAAARPEGATLHRGSRHDQRVSEQAFRAAMKIADTVDRAKSCWSWRGSSGGLQGARRNWPHEQMHRLRRSDWSYSNPLHTMSFASCAKDAQPR
jgi:hypothetical protein